MVARFSGVGGDVSRRPSGPLAAISDGTCSMSSRREQEPSDETSNLSVCSQQQSQCERCCRAGRRKISAIAQEDLLPSRSKQVDSAALNSRAEILTTRRDSTDGFRNCCWNGTHVLTSSGGEASRSSIVHAFLVEEACTGSFRKA